MKYGVLFNLLAILFAFNAITSGGWFFLLLWPAASFAVVGLAYLTDRHGVFGKRPDGTMAFVSVIALLPYLAYVWGIWHVIRILSREPPYHSVSDDILIGRRLLSSELPTGIRTVVDLTSEFPEPLAIRLVPQYFAVPMLDASCLPTETLAAMAQRVADAGTPVFNHCAQGHGRTGLMAGLLLVARGAASDGEDALARLQASRPRVKLNRCQKTALMDAAAILQDEDGAS